MQPEQLVLTVTLVRLGWGPVGILSNYPKLEEAANRRMKSFNITTHRAEPHSCQYQQCQSWPSTDMEASQAHIGKRENKSQESETPSPEWLLTLLSTNWTLHSLCGTRQCKAAMSSFWGGARQQRCIPGQGSEDPQRHQHREREHQLFNKGQRDLTPADSASLPL